MNKKKENMKTLFYIICVSGAFFLVISALSSFFFYVNGYFQFKDWIISVVSLAGALIGGIFTMLGVVLTLNRNISDKEKDEKIYLRTQCFIVKSEIKSYLDSIEKCVKNAINNKIYELSSDTDGFDYFCDLLLTFDSIYFMTDSLREKFYEVISKLDHDNKKNIINIFINLYTNHEMIKKICLDKSNKSEDILNKLIIKNFNGNFIMIKSNIFDSVDDIRKDFNEGKLSELELRIEAQKVINSYGEICKEKFLLDEYNNLLKFLDEVCED